MGRIKRLMDWFFPEIPWDKFYCCECRKAMGEYQYRVLPGMAGQMGYIQSPGRVRCMECAGKVAAE